MNACTQRAKPSSFTSSGTGFYRIEFTTQGGEAFLANYDLKRFDDTGSPDPRGWAFVDYADSEFPVEAPWEEAGSGGIQLPGGGTDVGSPIDETDAGELVPAPQAPVFLMLPSMDDLIDPPVPAGDNPSEEPPVSIRAISVYTLENGTWVERGRYEVKSSPSRIDLAPAVEPGEPEIAPTRGKLLETATVEFQYGEMRVEVRVEWDEDGLLTVALVGDDATLSDEELALIGLEVARQQWGVDLSSVRAVVLETP